MNRPPVSRLATLSLLVATGALAQTLPAADVEQQWIDPAGRGSLLVGNGQTLKALEWRVGVGGYFTRGNLRSGRTEFISSRLGVQVFGALGILDWLELSANVPVVVSQTGTGSSSLASAGLGNPWFTAKAALLDERHPVSLAAGLGVGIPIGTGPALGNGGLEVAPRIQVGHAYDTWQWGAELGYLYRPLSSLVPVTGVVGEAVGSQLWLAGTVTSVSATGPRGEVSVRAHAPLNGGTPGLEVQLGGRWPLGDVEVFFSAGPGFFGDPSTPLVRAYLGLAFGNVPLTQPLCVEGRDYPVAACPDLDKDGDGIKNSVDACPLEPEDKDGFEDGDGCPDRDNDRDGVPDASDRCPGVAGPVDNQGCPDADADGDGVVDRLDRCPAQAEDKDGFQDEDGCPDLDNDADGVADAQDACPDQAGPAGNRGCPARDTDGDGVADHEDNCPTVKGVKENAGCPATQRQLVVLTADKLKILDKVFFDLGRSSIQPRSLGLLDNVAQVLVAHPELKQVSIEGHTDNQGLAAQNKKLSQERADAVKAYLVKRGVEAARLTATGLGQEQPAESNDTPAGRDANRRVEFNLPR
jgi:outer membrane protein OmpA-like peptidoglycan-associated protein